MKKRQMKVPHMLNEAYQYDKPVPFSRGTRIDIRGISFLFISGTASINEKGESIHVGDFKAQAKRMLENVTELLKSEGATWHNVCKTTIYIKNMDEHYHELAEVRMQMFNEEGINEFPASVCVQATLCRPELLVEMEAIVLIDNESDKGEAMEVGC